MSESAPQYKYAQHKMIKKVNVFISNASIKSALLVYYRSKFLVCERL